MLNQKQLSTLTLKEIEDMKNILNKEISERNKKARNTPEFKVLNNKSKELNDKYFQRTFSVDVVIPVNIELNVEYYQGSRLEPGIYEFSSVNLQVNGKIDGVSNVVAKELKDFINYLEPCEDIEQVFQKEIKLLANEANKEYKKFYEQVEKAGYDLGEF